MSLSDQYLKDLQKLHENKSFGKSAKIPKKVTELINEYDVKSLLDFGCGKGNTTLSFKEAYPELEIFGYDPVLFPINLPDSVDLIYSSDVLEHIEPNLLQETLIDLKNRSRVMYHLIACHPAKKHLPDGRNAHLIVEEPEWWKGRLELAGLKIIYEDIVEHDAKLKKTNTTLHIKKYIVITVEK